jgi:serine/threonine protein kinase
VTYYLQTNKLLTKQQLLKMKGGLQRERFAASSFNDFNEVKEIYRSNAGIVYVGRFKYDSKNYVLKERKAPELGKRRDIMNEVQLLGQLDHQNVVRCEGWFLDEKRKSLFIVLGIN